MEMQSLLVGSYTQPEPHVPEGSGDGIYKLSFNNVDSSLQLVMAKKNNPTFLTRTEDGVIVSAHEVLDGLLCFWKLKDNKYQCIREIQTFQSFPCHVNSSGTNVIVTHYGSGNVQVYSRDQKLCDISLPFSKESCHQNTRQEGSHPHSSLVLSESEFLVADLGSDLVTLVENLEIKYSITMPLGSGPRHMAKHPRNSNCIFILNELNSSLCCLLRSGDSRFNIVDTVFLPNVTSLSLASHVEITDDLVIYCSMRHSSDADGEISWYSFDEQEHRMTFRGVISSCGKTPRHFTIVKSYLIVANQDSHNIIIFKVDEEGKPSKVDVIKCPSPVCLLSL